ncbi:hypothetical protein [Archangium sp.]|uniref:hypothetical protein n=1 Tax=Archangium sp. TaxID=1872627 RepID=UPI002ED9562F
MGKREERAPGAHREHKDSKPSHARHVFEEPATLREPAAPRVPRVMPPSAVSVIPLSDEERARAVESPPATLQEAREATDALLHEILEEDDAGAPEAPSSRTARPSSPEEDWPAELHSIHLPEV